MSNSLKKLFDQPSSIWPKVFDQGLEIDRSGVLAPEYLTSLGFEMTDAAEKADAIIRKAELSQPQYLDFEAEKRLAEEFSKIPNVFLIGEPRHIAPAAYRFADRNRTLAVAPGNEFSRMYFARPWADPQAETWPKRKDKFCLIGRPWPERIEWVQKLLGLGIEIDIYSQQSWPFAEWKGPAKDDVDTARDYKFRFVCENSLSDLYHSEKLFLGLKSGCVCFYLADPKLELPAELNGTHLRISEENLAKRYDVAAELLSRTNEFMFSSDEPLASCS